MARVDGTSVEQVAVGLLLVTIGGLFSPAHATGSHDALSGSMPTSTPASAPASQPSSVPVCTPAPAAVCTPIAPQVAASARQLDDWNLEFTPYLWVAGFRGEVGITVGEEELTTPIDVSFNELTKSLKIGAMGSVRFRYRRFGIMAEGNYISLGSESELAGSQQDTSMRAIFGTAYLSYGFEPWPGVTLNPYLGARWWWVGARVQIDGGLLDVSDLNADRAWADPIIGLFIRNNINDHWFVELTGDVGGGVSLVSWQIYGAVGYNTCRWFGLFAGYRLLGVNYDRDDFIFKLITQGFLGGLRFTI